MQNRFQATLARNGANWRADMVGETQRSLSRTRSSCMDTTTSPQAAPSPDAYSTVTRIHDSECGSRSKPMPMAAAQKPSHETSVSSHDPGKKFQYSSFQWGRLIGAGTFGRVALAMIIESGQMVAIKCISKAHTIAQGQLNHLRSETSLLSRLRHNFVVGSHGTFQDNAFVYLVLEYVAGGDFFKLLRDATKTTKIESPHTGGCGYIQTCLSECDARFYAGQVLIALDYLHKHRIAYRDLKPENLLVSEQGYLKMTDFGFAKRLTLNAKTFTFCGTPDYMSPEIILGHYSRGGSRPHQSGYGVEVDMWAFGCLVYEMIAGKGPFYTGDVKQTYRLILQSNHVLDGHFEKLKSRGQEVSKDGQDLIRSLLNPDPNLRLTTSQVFKHRWFAGLDFKLLYNGQYCPPFTRDSVKTGAYFDKFDLPPFEHPLLSESYTPSYLNALFQGF